MKLMGVALPMIHIGGGWVDEFCQWLVAQVTLC